MTYMVNLVTHASFSLVCKVRFKKAPKKRLKKLIIAKNSKKQNSFRKIYVVVVVVAGKKHICVMDKDKKIVADRS